MNSLRKYLEIGSSPHVTSGASVDTIMFNVVIALLPVCAFSVFAFGAAAALVLAIATLSCIATEYILNKFAGNPTTVGDWSVTITGLLYGYVSEEAGKNFGHDLAGWVVIPLAALLFGVTLWYLDRLLPDKQTIDMSELVARTRI